MCGKAEDKPKDMPYSGLFFVAAPNLNRNHTSIVLFMHCL